MDLKEKLKFNRGKKHLGNIQHNIEQGLNEDRKGHNSTWAKANC